jgi:hypothetical protein
MPDDDVSGLFITDKHSAQAILLSLQRAQEAYVKNLPSNHRLVLLASSNGETIRVDFAQWINPSTIIFGQNPHKEGEIRKVIVHHVSQLNVFLTSEPIEKYEKYGEEKHEEEPRRIIGFGPAE